MATPAQVLALESVHIAIPRPIQYWRVCEISTKLPLSETPCQYLLLLFNIFAFIKLASLYHSGQKSVKGFLMKKLEMPHSLKDLSSGRMALLLRWLEGIRNFL